VIAPSWSDLEVDDYDTWLFMVGQTVIARMNFSSGNFVHGH